MGWLWNKLTYDQCHDVEKIIVGLRSCKNKSAFEMSAWLSSSKNIVEELFPIAKKLAQFQELLKQIVILYDEASLKIIEINNKVISEFGNQFSQGSTISKRLKISEKTEILQIQIFQNLHLYKEIVAMILNKNKCYQIEHMELLCPQLNPSFPRTAGIAS